MPKRQEEFIGSFDIGTRKIKIALASITGDSYSEKLDILAYADKELSPWTESDEYLGDILEELLSRVETKAKIRNVDYRGFPISLESIEAFYKIKEITIPINGTILLDPQLLQQINKEAIEKFEENLSEGRVLADYIIGYKIDGEFYPDILDKEVSMVNVLIGAIYVPNKIINQFEKALDMINIREYVFEYKPISAAYFIPLEAKEKGCFQIHGQWQDFDIIYWYRDKALSLKKLPYGMRMLSKDVEKVFKMTRNVAENLIFNEFKSIREEDISEGVIKVALKSGEESEISRQFFQRVLEARMDEISEQLKSVVDSISTLLLKEYDIKADLSRIYLTGDFINLKGVKEILSKYFRDTKFVIPSVEEANILIMGDKRFIADISNLPLLGNLANYSNEVLNKVQINKNKPKLFGIFKKRGRN